MQYGDPFYDQVLPGIGITNVLSASEIDKVVANGYTACLNASEFDFEDDARDRVAYRWIPLVDGAGNDLEAFADAVETLARFRAEGLVTLVNCYAGVSRSASIVAAYMVRHQSALLDRIAAERLASPPPQQFRLLHGNIEVPDAFRTMTFSSDPVFQRLWKAFLCVSYVRPVVYMRPVMWEEMFPPLREYLAGGPAPRSMVTSDSGEYPRDSGLA